MKDLSLPLRVLPRGIVGLESTMRAAGLVFTIRVRPDATLDKHTSLDESAGLMSRAPAGHVVVCQPHDARAQFDGLCVQALKLKGVRDPHRHRLHLARRGVRGAVTIGGQQVLPDDPVLADRDGIILVGAADVKAVADAAGRKTATEGDTVHPIRAGADPQAVYLRYGVFLRPATDFYGYSRRFSKSSLG